MKRFSIVTMLLAAIALAGVPYAWGGQVPAASSDPDNKPSRPRLLGRAVLKHRVRHRSGR